MADTENEPAECACCGFRVGCYCHEHPHDKPECPGADNKALRVLLFRSQAQCDTYRMENEDMRRSVGYIHQWLHSGDRETDKALQVAQWGQDVCLYLTRYAEHLRSENKELREWRSALAGVASVLREAGLIDSCYMEQPDDIAAVVIRELGDLAKRPPVPRPSGRRRLSR